jgi:hypothetical protein
MENLMNSDNESVHVMTSKESVRASGHTVDGQLLDASHSGDLQAYGELRASLVLRRQSLLAEAAQIAERLGMQVTPDSASLPPRRADAVKSVVARKPSGPASVAVDVLRFLKSGGGYFSVAAIALSTGIANHHVSMALQDLRKAGKLKSKGKARGKSWAAR